MEENLKRRQPEIGENRAGGSLNADILGIVAEDAADLFFVERFGDKITHAGLPAGGPIGGSGGGGHGNNV